MYNAGLILEGGAFRGIFTAGVLDFFMEKELFFPYVIGVSAGACCAFNYVANQPHRTKDCMLYRNGADSYYGLHTFIETHRIIDFEKLFFEYPHKQFPFDSKTYKESETVNETVVSNCLTGKAEYFCEKDSFERGALVCEASCAVPFFTEPVTISDTPYMDGGITDPIPLKRSIEKGNSKNIVILTKHEGFKSKLNPNIMNLSSRLLRKYPEFAVAYAKREEVYAEEVHFLNEQVSNGDVFLIRPEVHTIDVFEFSESKLLSFYEHGYKIGEKCYPQLMKFLGDERIDK